MYFQLSVFTLSVHQKNDDKKSKVEAYKEKDRKRKREKYATEKVKFFSSFVVGFLTSITSIHSETLKRCEYLEPVQKCYIRGRLYLRGLFIMYELSGLGGCVH